MRDTATPDRRNHRQHGPNRSGTRVISPYLRIRV